MLFLSSVVSLKSYSGVGAELHKLKPNILDEAGPAGGSAAVMLEFTCPRPPRLPISVLPRFKVLGFPLSAIFGTLGHS